MHESGDSSVGIEIATGWTAGVRLPVLDFPLVHGVKTCFGARAALYSVGTGASFPRDKADGE
jgi:hypothetical protein